MFGESSNARGDERGIWIKSPIPFIWWLLPA